MTQKINQPVLARNLIDGLTQKISEPNNGTVKDQAVTVRRARLNLDGLTINVAAANDYGGTKIMDLPDTNLVLLGVEVNCTVTKAGTTNGIVAATDLDMSIGTAVAAATPLATTAIDVIEKVDINDDALSVTFQAHSNDQSTAAFPLVIGDGASNALYMNLAAAITADDSVSVSGTVDIYYVDVGNAGS